MLLHFPTNCFKLFCSALILRDAWGTLAAFNCPVERIQTLGSTERYVHEASHSHIYSPCFPQTLQRESSLHNAQAIGFCVAGWQKYQKTSITMETEGVNGFGKLCTKVRWVCVYVLGGPPQRIYRGWVWNVQCRTSVGLGSIQLEELLTAVENWVRPETPIT